MLAIVHVFLIAWFIYNLKYNEFSLIHEEQMLQP